MNSRSKGKAGELEVIKILCEYWPKACRNLDQARGSSGQDVLNTEGIHFQIKRTERLEIWKALEQTHSEAAELDLPVLVFRRSRSEWHACLPLEELLPLLALKTS
jgi:hypothetical protein